MSAPPFSARKRRIHARAQSFARERARWLAKASFFHAEDLRYLRFLVPEGARVIELGCGTGDLLSGLRPGRGVGVDFSPAMIEQARTRHPGMEFHVADLEDPAWASGVEGPFDYLLMIDTIGSLDDCQRAFEVLQPLCDQHSRIIVAYYANFWEPLLKFAERVGRKMPTDSHNVLSAADIGGLLNLAGLEVSGTIGGNCCRCPCGVPDGS